MKVDGVCTKVNEDGSAEMSFDVDEEAQKWLAELGLKLLITASAYDKSTQEVLDSIASL